MTCLGSAIGYGVSWTLQRKDGYGASLHRQCNGLQNCKLQKQGDGGAPAVLGLSIFLVSPLIAPLSPCPKIRSLHCNAATVSTTQRTAEERVATLSEALPFIQRFQGKTVVVKYGGAAMKDETLMDGVIKDLVLLSCVGLKPIFVHGGGPEINQLLGKLNIESKFQNGLRVTDAATMEVVQMVLVGKVNKSLVSLIHRVGGTAVGLSGIDGRLITAEPLDSALGFVGRVTSINRMVLDGVMKDGCIPVIATVASDGMGNAYNVNADIAAGEIAATLGAEKLILMTDVPGLLTNPKDPDTLVRMVDVAGVKTLIADGVISGGMIPKVDCCMNALAKGVHATHIIDGRLPHSLLLEILTNEGAGTMINALI